MQFVHAEFLLAALVLLAFIPFAKERLLTLAAALLAIALAQPIIQHGYRTIDGGDVEVILALDLSRSMELTDVHPNRKSLAIEKLKKFITLSPDFPKAVILFGAHSYIAAPLTVDKNTLLERLEAITDFTDTKGTNFRSLIKNATLLFDGLNRHILFFSDGGDRSDTKDIGTLAKKMGITLHALCIATDRTMHLGQNPIPFNSDFQKEITTSGGLYQRYSDDDSDIDALLDWLELQGKKKLKIPNQTELYFIPTLFALIILFIRRYILLVALTLLLHPTPSSANYLGYLQLKLHNYELAVKLLSPPKNDVERYNLAYALQKLGKTNEAAALLRSIKSKALYPKAQYNLAMLYAKNRAYQKALDTLLALKSCCNSPKVEAAIEAIKKILKKRKPKPLHKSRPHSRRKKFLSMPLGIDESSSSGGKPW